MFAGAELRERLNLGERREDILAGLHRAIMLRAMSLLARSGGVDDEFTFTGGVARNPAAVGTTPLRELVAENYGERTINISPNRSTPARSAGRSSPARAAEDAERTERSREHDRRHRHDVGSTSVTAGGSKWLQRRRCGRLDGSDLGATRMLSMRTDRIRRRDTKPS